MREPNRKNTKSGQNISAANEKKADKEKIKKLAQKKREMQKELDELKGNTARGKAVCVLAFFVITALLLGIFVGMVKLDTGGVASEALAPVIADVPVLRNILPAEMQKKNASELAAEQIKQEEAAAQQAEQAAAQQAAADAAAAAEAEAAAQQAAAEEAAAEAAAEQAAAEAEAAAEEAAEEAAAEEAKALQDYVDTYSAMKPKDAATVFDSMMPDQEDLIVRILENLTSKQRAAILSKMSVANAAILTEKMQK